MPKPDQQLASAPRLWVRTFTEDSDLLRAIAPSRGMGSFIARELVHKFCEYLRENNVTTYDPTVSTRVRILLEHVSFGPP